jgi:hypothetical protein
MAYSDFSARDLMQTFGVQFKSVTLFADVPLYGCVTTGIEWRFLTHRGHEIGIDEKRYLISDPARLLGVLQAVVNDSKAQTDAARARLF